MRIKKKRRIPIKIDMTPMVDIAFLLLIFYMSTTQFKPPEKKAVRLPSSHSQIELPDKNKIIVTVTPEDSIFVDYIEVVEKEVDGKKMNFLDRIYEEATVFDVGSIITQLRIRNPQALVVIKADKDAKFGTMQKIMDSMVDQDLTRFQVITELEAEKI